MSTKPFDHDAFEEVIPLLSRGFPGVTRETWIAGVRSAALAPRPDLPLGYVMTADGAPVGVILTLASRRDRPGAEAVNVVNLSSWYVEPAHRVRAPAMLRRAVADPTLTYTDLTATDATGRMNQLLGFRPCAEERVLVPLPLAAASLPDRAEMVTHEKLPPAAVSPAMRRLLEDHAELGCVSAALADDDGWHPLVFIRRRRFGVPGAMLGFAESPARVLRHLGTVARFLLRRSAFVLSADGLPAGERLPACAWRTRRRPRFVKGPGHLPGLDYAYSELVLFGV